MSGRPDTRAVARRHRQWHELRGAPAVVQPVRDEHKSPATLADLTPAQVRILRRLPRGLSDKEIARELSLAPCTVRNQLTRIYGRLGLPSGGSLRVMAAVWYLQQEGKPR